MFSFKWFGRAVLAFGLMAAATGQVEAQTCTNHSDFSGSVSTGDGSSWSAFGLSLWNSDDQLVLSIPGQGGSFQYTENTALPIGDYYFRGGATPPCAGCSSPYFPSPPSGSASCVQSGESCVSCSGNASGIQLYSGSGVATGRLLGPLGTPVGAPVTFSPYASTLGCASLGTTSDASGFYTTQTSEENTWGFLTVAGDGSGPGSRTYYTMFCHPGADPTPTSITVTSNKADSEDHSVTYPTRDDEQPKGPSCPWRPPTNVGGPVHVLSGNVWLDQTDIVIPGSGVSLEFTRSYNSWFARQGIGGSFGWGWSHTYERKLTVVAGGYLSLRKADGQVVSFHDPEVDGTYVGFYPPTETSRFVQGSEGGSTIYTRQIVGGGSEVYDANGRLIRVVDDAGRAVTLDYDGQGRLGAVTEPGGRALYFAYDGGSSRITTLSGPAGLLATYAYTWNGHLERVTHPDGTGLVFSYDSSQQLLSVVDLQGEIVETHEYDSKGRGLTSARADGRETYTLTYEPHVTTVTDSLGNVTTYEWITVKGVKRVNRITGPCSGCGGGGGSVQEWSYDELGRVASHTDALGGVTTYAYNLAGQVVQTTDPAGRVTNYSYDSEGRLRSETGPNAATTVYTHGSAGPLTVTDPLDRTTTFTYDAQGRVETITDSRSKTTTLTYNAAGDLASVKDPLNNTTSFAYDAMGRRTSVTDPLSQTTTTAYDVRGRVTAVTSPDGTKTVFGYDESGRRSSVVDPMGRETRYLYDKYGQLEKVVDPMKGVTGYGYDLMGNLTSLTDAEGRTTSFEYDGHARVTRMVYPGGAAEVFTYDAAGRLATKTDRKGTVTTYAYDVLGRLTGKAYSDGTPAVSYGYDLAGRLASAANGSDTLTWSYDLAGQLLSEASSFNASTVAYTYDNGGNRMSVSLDGQVFVTYAYDDASRLTTISRGSNNFSFAYDAASRRTSMTYPNGIVTTYSYDTLSRLTNLAANLGATPITSFNYTYDAAGNRTSKAQLDYTEQYSYDPLYRLKGVERDNGAKRWLYDYDKVGNRILEQVDSRVSLSSYNEKNQLLSETGGGPLRWRGTLDEAGSVAFTSPTVNGKPARMLAGNVFEAELDAVLGTNQVTVQAQDLSGNVTTKTYQVEVTGDGASYSYDANGNLTQKIEGGNTWTYEWNAENQLTTVKNNGVTVASFKYDPIGRRVEKVAGGITYSFAYDGEDILREGRGPSAFRYIHGEGIDEPLARESGASALDYFHADVLGSIVRRTGQSGGVVHHYSYDVWGGIQVGASEPGYAFTGREWDPETRLYFSRARYYDTSQGRFTSEDPIGLDGGLNLYAYVGNDPTNWIDPFGLAPADPTKDKLFMDWWEGEKAKRGMGPADHADNRTLKKAYEEWESLGKPRGPKTKGKPWKRGRIRGPRGFGSLCVVTTILDAAEYAEEQAYCSENPCECEWWDQCKI